MTLNLSQTGEKKSKPIAPRKAGRIGAEPLKVKKPGGLYTCGSGIGLTQHGPCKSL